MAEKKQQDEGRTVSILSTGIPEIDRRVSTWVRGIGLLMKREENGSVCIAAVANVLVFLLEQMPRGMAKIVTAQAIITAIADASGGDVQVIYTDGPTSPTSSSGRPN